MPVRTPGPPNDPLSEWYATTLEDVLPRRGFVYPEGHKVFRARQDWVLVKWAIEAAAPDLEEDEVDNALAAIMNDANAIMKHYYGSSRAFANLDGQTRNTTFSNIIETACGEHEWTAIVPIGRFPRLMKELFRARALYNELSHIRGLPEEDKYKQDGKLAKAIDEWVGTQPVVEPDERYARLGQHLIDYIVDKTTKGEDVDSDLFDDGDSENDDDQGRWISWTELWHSKDSKYTRWVHNNYFWSKKDKEDEDDDDMTNALLLTN
ncbi:hypothetical protein F5Y13DRAFT_148979 [Hypoxylon sp. FL1857]|nr:hypothetical protein F5Y13DRAFT_148979 [Hypoxylon sp. FL1857]